MGIVDCRILNFLNRPITLSTCILTFDIFLEAPTSFPDICDFPFVKFGTFNVAPYVASSSEIVKPRSASIRSPCCKTSRKPDLIVISLSDTRPPHPRDKKLTAPAGVIASRYFIVLVFL